MQNGQPCLRFDRRQVHRVLLHVGGFLLIFLAAYWLRGLTPSPDPSFRLSANHHGLFAFVFAAVTLVRFQGTQDRISLILGSGFLLSGATLTATSVLFFQLMHESQLWFFLGARGMVDQPVAPGDIIRGGAGRGTFPASFAASAPGNRGRRCSASCH